MKKSEDKHIRYIDSTTHRVYKMVGRPFVLHNGSQKLRIKVNLVDFDSKNNGLASIKIENGRGHITIPVAEGMLSGRTERPIEIGLENGRRVFLSARVSRSSAIIKAQNVSLTMFAENGED